MQLRPYQEPDVEFYCERKFGLLLYKPRVGKTVTSCAFLDRMKAKRTILIVPKSAFATWYLHLHQWFGEKVKPEAVRVVYVRGNAQQRQAQWRAARTPERTFFITTYAAAQRDLDDILKLGIDACIYDEAGKRLINRKTKNFAVALAIRKVIRCGLILSGTLIDRHAGEMWAPVHWCAPNLYKSYWQWFTRYVETFDNGFGTEIIGNKHSEIQHLHSVLRHWAIARRRDVTTCPPKRKELWPVEMTKEQAHLYKTLQADKWVITPSGSGIFASTSMEQQLRLRQLLTCPGILEPSLGVGGAMEAIVDELEDLPTDDQHCAIFTAFKAALPIWRDYLIQQGHPNVILLHGGLEPEEQLSRLDSYRTKKGIALVSIEYAEAFSLAPATLAYFLGYSWSAGSNEQAEDRMIPQQGDPITIKYCVYQNTIDAAVAKRVMDKFDNVSQVMGFMQ